MKLDRLLGDGSGPAWLAWRRKVDRLAPGVAVLDVLGRADWPGDDASWDGFVQLQHRAREACQAGAGEDWQPPPPKPPERIPVGMWRGLGQLEQTTAVETAGEWVSDWHNPDTRRRQGLLLAGAVGAGKTTIASALAHDTDPYAYWHVVDLLQWLMDGYTSGEFSHRFNTVSRRKLLVLDDLGVERDTDGQLDLVVKLLDLRHRNSTHTVVTTNLPSAQRANRYGHRIESRLLDMCQQVVVLGGDRRAA